MEYLLLNYSEFNGVLAGIKEPGREFAVGIVAYICPNCGAKNFSLWPMKKWKKERKYDSDVEKHFKIEKDGEMNRSCAFCGRKLSTESEYMWDNAESELSSFLCRCTLCPNRFDLNKFRKVSLDFLLSSLAADIERGEPDPEQSIYGDVESLFIKMENKLAEAEKAYAAQAVKDYIEKAEQSNPQSLDQIKTSDTNISSSQLRDYIYNLFKLEMNIYSLCKRLPSLYYDRYEIDRAFHAERCSWANEHEQKIAEAEAIYQEYLDEPDPEETIELEVESVPDPIKPQKPGEPAYKKLGFFNKKKVMAENEILMASYNKALREYGEACMAYEKQVKQVEGERAHNMEIAVQKRKMKIEVARKEHLARIEEAQNVLEELKKEQSLGKTPTSVVKAMLDQDILDAENMLKSSIECRNKLYNMSVIFRKYRDSVALATFCEYLDAGRCSALEGKDGAYNLYEAECRANKIIAQLSQIASSLEQIKANQYTIYTELRLINGNLETFNENMNYVMGLLDESNTHLENIEHDSNIIAYNTERTAYYSKVNAELTNALGYLIALG